MRVYVDACVLQETAASASVAQGLFAATMTGKWSHIHAALAANGGSHSGAGAQQGGGGGSWNPEVLHEAMRTACPGLHWANVLVELLNVPEFTCSDAKAFAFLTRVAKIAFPSVTFPIGLYLTRPSLNAAAHVSDAFFRRLFFLFCGFDVLAGQVTDAFCFCGCFS